MQNEIGRLRRKFREARADLFGQTAGNLNCRELLESHTSLVDGIVVEIYQISCRYAEKQAARCSHSGLAIVATGGYGRKELNPFSDIDIAFIPSEEADPWVEAAVHMAFKLVMDVFLSFREVHVGYSYRPVAELSTWDTATLTAMLDARQLCGDQSLTQALRRELHRNLSPLDLILEIGGASERSNNLRWDGLYSVEPNLKSGAGALRDLQRARWIFKLLLDVSDDELFDCLISRSCLSQREAVRVQSATEWFLRARNWLHLITGKRSDVLINNYQDRIARDLENCSAQEWLARHYSHAETIAVFLNTAVRSTMKGPVDLGGVLLEDGCLHFTSGLDNEGYPSAIKMLHLSQRFDIPISLTQMGAMENVREDRAALPPPSDQELWDFLNILNESRGISATLRTMARLGLMERFIEGFGTMMRFVPPDPAHRYTVGDHSARIVECLEDLRHGRDIRGQRFSELLNQCSHFDVLCLAALLHDSGKLAPGSDHSEAAMGLTLRVGERLRLAPEKRMLLGILVRHHLLLVRTARLQDLKSAGVIQNVAEKLQSPEALRHLYVFTYADTRAVGDNSWTSMDYRDLEDLYGKVLKIFSGKAGEESEPETLETKMGQIRRKLAASPDAIGDDDIKGHCDAMSADYVLNTPLDEIAFHLQLLRRLEKEKIVLDIYNRPGDDYSELTVCTYDDPQPGMLAKIAGVLYGCTTDIHKAQVFTMEKAVPLVIDTLWIRSGGMQISENRARRIQTALREVLSGAVTIDQFLKKAGKNPPGSIIVDNLDLRNDLSEEHTVVHVVARDLQGLLYLMTRALSRSGLHIHSAKVATWNACGENNFYTTTLSGEQIPDSDLPQWKQHLLRMFQGMGAE